jgi:hypothetical protein
MNKNSRIVKYQLSIEEFSFEEENSPFNNSIYKDEKYTEIIKENFKESDKFLSILFLTVMNSQLKKEKTSIQGYSAACGIEIVYLLFKIYDNKELMYKKYGDYLNDIIFKLSFNWFTSIKINLESLRRKVDPKKYTKYSNAILNLVSSDIPVYINRLALNKTIVFQNESSKKKSDLPVFYMKNKPELLNYFNSINLIDKSFIKSSLMDNVCSIGELSCGLGWLFGLGSEKKIDTVKEFGRTFSLLYVLCRDFENIEIDLKNAYESTHKYSFNFVINNGFQKSYEMYNDYKNVFITEANKLDVYTGTIKEMMDYIEEKIDNVINDTSPDLKSTLTGTLTI